MPGYFQYFLTLIFLSRSSPVSPSPQSSELKSSPRIDRWQNIDQYGWSDTCEEKLRTPINLKPEDADLVNYDEIVFDNYDSKGPVIMENDGNTGIVKGFLTWEHPPSITGGNLNSTYFLRQINFHWSNDHKYSGVDYPAELHLVHISIQYNPQKNNSSPKDLAVVAVPILAGENEVDLEELKPIYEEKGIEGRRLSPYPESRDGTSLSPFTLLPWDTTTYYRYIGSLSTPPCANDGVIWTVMLKPIVLSSKQLYALKKSHLHKRPHLPLKVRNSELMQRRQLYLNRRAKNPLFMEQKGQTELCSDDLARAEAFFLILLIGIGGSLYIICIPCFD